jgi:hypothetical protein
MLFKDAIVQLQGRIPMHRTGWNPQDGYIVLMPGMAYIWKIVLQPAPNAGNYILIGRFSGRRLGSLYATFAMYRRSKIT